MALRAPRTLASNSLWAGAGEMGRIGTQAILLVVVARELGPDGFGRFAATTTLLQLSAPLIWCGAYNLLMQRVATGSATLSDACSMALTTILLTGPLGLCVLAVTARPALLDGVGVVDFAILAAAELFYMGFVETLAITGWAAERLVQSTAVRWVTGLCRLGGAGLVVLAGEVGGERTLYCAYLVSTAAAAVVCLILVRAWYGLRIRLLAPERTHLRMGLSFAVGGSAFMVQDNIDKPLLLGLAGPGAAGTYTAGYRVVIVALMPIRALLMASVAQFFRVGNKGLRPASALARKRSLPAMAYAIGAAVVIFISADQVARFFGQGFEEAADVMRWLCVLPLIRSCYVFVGDALTGAGLQPERARLMVCATALNVALNVVLIPPLSWRGAAIATLVSEIALGLALWALLHWHLRREVRASGPPDGGVERVVHADPTPLVLGEPDGAALLVPDGPGSGRGV